MEEQTKNSGKRKGGRPKKKHGKSINFYLSFDTIKKLNQMTTLTRNNSEFVENLIIKEYSQPAA